MSTQIRYTAIAAGIYIAAVVTAWILRGTIDYIEVAITLAFIWLCIDRVAQHERDEESRADIDETSRRVDAITAHLTGNDLSSNGRHATPANEPPHYKPSPRPRSAA